MQRISVVGNSGSGKTTVAKAIADVLGVPHLELDGVFHQPDWRPLDTEEFRRIVSEFTAAESWVVDGNYSGVRDIVWGRADTVVWVDPPRHRVMRQLLARTMRRMATRSRSVERKSGAMDLPVQTRRSRYSSTPGRATASSGPGFRPRRLTRRTRTCRFVRLRTPAETAALVRDLAGPDASATRTPPERRQA